MPDPAKQPAPQQQLLPPLKLAVGDRVIYPNQGLCSVSEIKTDHIAGQTLVFVTLVFMETGAKVKIPQDKLARNGVRRVSSPDDVKRVFEFLKSESERASLDWKKRARDNTARLTEGGLLGLAEVVKGLQVLSELRPLPPKEREQYNDARHLFVSELSAAMHISTADAEDSLDLVLSPVGKERPKRSVEEFRALAGDDDLDELLGLDGEVSEAQEPDAEAAPAEEGESESGGEEEAAPPAAPKRGRPPKTKGAPPARPAKVHASPEPAKPTHDPAKKKARPAPAPAAEPKRRGRPPKPKPAVAEAPKKRGRPPKKK